MVSPKPTCCVRRRHWSGRANILALAVVNAAGEQGSALGDADFDSPVGKGVTGTVEVGSTG